jgi:DNA repair protein SbcD/Mre11
MRFLHAADIHLDSRLLGLERYEGAPVEEIRSATRRAFERLVALARDESVDFVLIAGDLYDGDWTDYNTGLFFVYQITDLQKAGIPVFVIAGNHDAANKMTRSLRLPPNPTGGSPLLGHRAPETRVLEELGVAIHGQSFAQQSESDNLARQYPPALPGLFNIGLLHTSLEGDRQHATYAPCSLDDLRGKEYQYWALGHIHQRRIVSEDPFVAYPGNIQGRHIRETGEKGCLLVEVDQRHEIHTKFEPLDVFRWETLEVNCQDAATVSDVLERFQRELEDLIARHGTMPLGVRVVFSGPCEAHQHLVAGGADHVAEIRAAVHAVGRDQVWIEKVKFATQYPPRPRRGSHWDGPVAELVGLLDELSGDQGDLEPLIKELKTVQDKLPVELQTGVEPLNVTDPAWIRDRLAEVKPLLIQRLTHSTDDS